MSAVRATLRTFAVLLGIWLTLALLALGFGVVPGVPAPPWIAREIPDASVATEPEPRDAGTDAIPEVLDGGLAAEPRPAADAGPPPPPRVLRPRWIVCPEPAVAPSLAAVPLFGDGRPELVVGCGDTWHVLALAADGTPWRVARVVAPALRERDEAGATGAAAAGDFDGDGADDLVLPFARYGAGGAARGGGLYLVPRDRFGSLAPPRALAPIAATAVWIGPVDAQPPNDLAVLNLANPFARLPSEGWVFAGGPSPTRRAVLRTGPAATGIALVDLDVDRHADVVITTGDEARVDVFFGDGTGAFPRRNTLAIPAAAAVVVGDVDGDGHEDAIVEAAGIVAIHARPMRGEAALLQSTRLEQAPSTIRGIAARDLDADGDAEIVGWDHPRLLVVEPRGGPPRAWLELDGGDFAPRRQILADLDGEGAAGLILLGVTALDGERSLELVIVGGRERGVLDVGERRAVEDAPLSLRVPLPDAEAP